jgi:2-C-methyl-D-erythritol 4-phosphate cytidylyltransferase
VNLTIAALITAAGSSERFGSQKKEYVALPARFDNEGRPLTVLGATVGAFLASARISTLAITVPPDPSVGEKVAREAIGGRASHILFTTGGPTREDSVRRGLLALEKYGKPDFVLIHDGSRPWVSVALIERVLDAALSYGAAIPILPLVDTPKELGEPDARGTRFITQHLRRSRLGAAQTPQAFAFDALLAAHKKAATTNAAYTDDAEIWGAFVPERPIAAVAGDLSNRKITYPNDLNFTNVPLKTP